MKNLFLIILLAFISSTAFGQWTTNNGVTTTTNIVGIGTTSPNASYSLTVGGSGLFNSWVRVNGKAGLYFQTYGGGFYMKDNTWIRTFNNKSFYHNTGIMRTDGTFQVGNQGARFLVQTDGNVGIGTTTLDPSAKLTIKGSVNIGADVNATLKVRNITGKKTTSTDADHLFLQYNSGKNVYVGHKNGALSNLYISGKTIIGDITAPGNYSLYVQNGVLTEKVKVAVKSTNQWADYVFDKNYELKSLEEVANFIEENKHLPNVPSAEEVVQDGIDMAKMDAKLLEKIEELTLYVIQLNEEVKQLKKENEKLSK